MRCTRTRRLCVAWTIAFVAGFSLPFGSAAVAGAEPPPSAVTTAFAVPATFVSGCFSLLVCAVPPVVSVTPSASIQALGVVTFTAEQSPVMTTLDCIDLAVNWRNLSTGAAGTTVLRGVTPMGFSRPIAAVDWCRYTPVRVVTGSGTVAAFADVVASVDPNRFQLSVAPGFGSFGVP